MAPITHSTAHLTALSASDLAGRTLLQLRELASRLGIGGYTSLGRDALVQAVSRALPQGVQSDDGPSQPGPVESIARQAAVQTHVVFLPRDPQWAYVFWEISAADRQRAQDAGARQLCLRLADVTGLPLGAPRPHAVQELVVNADGNEWYLPVPLGGRSYRVELGYRLAAGGWWGMAVSSVADVPASEPSDVVADAFVPFALEGALPAATPVVGGGGVEHERMYQRAMGPAPRSRRVGSEVLHELDQDMDQLRAQQASGAGFWASGRSESGSGGVRARSFWLVADAELIVYGATEPNASLYLGDRLIPLAEDGTFRVHVPFRDGQQLYPIRAIAADGEQERSIRLEFDRRTPAARVNTREQAVLEWF